MPERERDRERHNLRSIMNVSFLVLEKFVAQKLQSLCFMLDKYHAWVNAEFLLEKCLVGILDDSQ